MKSVVFEGHGGLDVLKPADMPEPQPQEGEVRVKVKSCALNHLDIWVREGLPGNPKIPMPHIGGCDISGTLDALGSGVKDSSFKIGAPVLVASGVSCGECEFCRANRDPLCKKFNILGFQRQGGLAEKICVPARSIIPLSASSRYLLSDWAAFPLVFTTAWSMLMEKVKLQAGETILVQAAGSGIGSAAIQFAKAVGAKVITTVGEDWKIAEAKKLGADEVLNYKKEDFEKRVKDLTEGRGVDVAFEHIGPEVFVQSLRCLAPGGRLVTCGSTSGPDVTFNLRALFSKNVTVFGNYMGSIDGLKKAVQWAEEGRLKPLVGKTFPLDQTREAQRCMISRDFFGKIVVTVS